MESIFSEINFLPGKLKTRRVRKNRGKEEILGRLLMRRTEPRSVSYTGAAEPELCSRGRVEGVHPLEKSSYL